MLQSRKIHFIAIGGSVMHNLAIALSKQGISVSGSDDDIQDPSQSLLRQHQLLPDTCGWFPEKIDRSLDTVVLGMHARKDNPELLKALEIGVPVLSFPEFILSQSIDKQRIVVGGSHGKTTIAAIIAHVLSCFNRKFDLVIGATLAGMENPVRLSDAPIIVIEGDEYLSSPIDLTPKFLKYQHHMAIISGIAWDHANVFPTQEEYIRQFERFAEATPKGGTLIYNEEDPVSKRIGQMERADIQSIPYKTHEHHIQDGQVFLHGDDKKNVPIKIFGCHNLQNIAAAKALLKKIGITAEQFYEAITTFEGASGRLHKLAGNGDSTFFKDFAHAPSKVKATTEAVKSIYPKRELVGCLELHTYSSLNKRFLPEYKNSMDSCETAIVYYNPENLKKKKLEPFSDKELKAAFHRDDLKIYKDRGHLQHYLESLSWNNKNLLMMSSGNFSGLDINRLAQDLVHQPNKP